MRPIVLIVLALEIQLALFLVNETNKLVKGLEPCMIKIPKSVGPLRPLIELMVI